jgi:Tfp pilus assembly protein PilF
MIRQVVGAAGVALLVSFAPTALERFAAVGPAAAAEQLSADRAVQAGQRRVSRYPASAGAHHRLGDAYVLKFRESGDPAYLDLAERSLRRVLELAPNHAGAVRHIAYVHSARHEFVDAEREARRAVALDPADGDAWGVLGDALLELGRYGEAGEAYGAMAARGAGLPTLARLSGLKSLMGDPEGAIADLERALEAGMASGQPTESMAWARCQLAQDRFGQGDLAGAERDLAAALAVLPGYHRAIAGLAQVRAAQGRDGEAVDLYRRALAAIPLPEYAAALGDVYTRMGRAADARRQYELVEYVARLDAARPALYNRELVYFYADHGLQLDRALVLAERELAARRDIGAHDALAWTLLQLDRPAEARVAMERALALGTRDARLFFHAGMIYRRLGDFGRARDYLARALETNRHFHPLQAEIARRALVELDAAAPPAALRDAGTAGAAREVRYAP